MTLVADLAKQLNRMNLAGLLFVVLFSITMAYSLYDKGLFFKPDQTYVSAAILVVGGIGFFILARAWRRTPPIWFWFAAAYAAYAWLTTFWAANPASAVNGAVIITAAVLLAGFVPYLKEYWRRLLLSLFAWSGPAMYLFGMLTLYGVFQFQQAVVHDTVQKQYELNSVLQYHNALGSYELATALVATLLSVSAARLWVRVAYFSAGAMSIVAVVASTSREVWILVPIMFAVALLASWWQRKVYPVFLATAAVLIVGIVASPFTLSAMHTTSLKSFLVTIGIAIFGSAIIAWLFGAASKFNRATARWGLVAVIVIVPVLVGVAALKFDAHQLNPILMRLQSIHLKDSSIQGRLWYYGAGLHMWLSNPVFGSGYGTWYAKFQAFEQYPYWSTMTHSIFIDQLVNFGIIGTLVWIGFFVTAIKSAIRACRQKTEGSVTLIAASLAGLSLVLHSLFDFDMDYPAILMICFVLIATGTETHKPYIEFEKEAPSRFLPAVWSMLTLLGVVFGVTLSVSEVLSNHAQTTINPAEKTALFERAKAWALYDPVPHYQLANIYYNQYQASQDSQVQQKAWTEAQWASRLAKWDPKIQQGTAVIAYHMGNLSQAYHWALNGARDGKLSITYPSAFMGMALWAGVNEYPHNLQDATVVFQTVLNTFTNTEQHISYINSLPNKVNQTWDFEVDAPTVAYGATAEYCMGAYKQSLADMKSIPTAGRDTDTMGLLQIVLYLDGCRIQKTTPLTTPPGLSKNPTLVKEYQLLKAIGPLT